MAERADMGLTRAGGGGHNAASAGGCFPPLVNRALTHTEAAALLQRTRSLWVSAISGDALSVTRRDTRQLELLHVAQMLAVPQALLMEAPCLPDGTPTFIVRLQPSAPFGNFPPNSACWHNHCNCCDDLVVPPHPQPTYNCLECTGVVCALCCAPSSRPDLPGSTGDSPDTGRICAYCLLEKDDLRVTDRMRLVEEADLRAEADREDEGGQHRLHPRPPEGFPYCLAQGGGASHN